MSSGRRLRPRSHVARDGGVFEYKYFLGDADGKKLHLCQPPQISAVSRFVRDASWRPTMPPPE
jgi:hypothetical protein